MISESVTEAKIKQPSEIAKKHRTNKFQINKENRQTETQFKTMIVR